MGNTFIRDSKINRDNMVILVWHTHACRSYAHSSIRDCQCSLSGDLKFRGGSTNSSKGGGGVWPRNSSSVCVCGGGG